MFSREWIYNSLLVHRVYVGVNGFSKVYGGVCTDIFIYGFV